MGKFLKWGGIGLGSTLLLGAIALIAWSFISTRQLDGRIAAIQARGEPILPEDFKRSVPAESDAMVELRQAHAIARQYARSPAVRELEASKGGPQLPVIGNEASLLREVVAENAEALRLLDAAGGKPDADWRWIPDAAGSAMMPGWNEHRRLANLARQAALLAIDERRSEEALRGVERMLTLADAAERHPSFIGHLVGLGVAALAGSTAAEIAPDLEPERAVPRAQLQTVIRRLLDTGPSQAGWRWACQGERAMQLDMLRAVMENRPVAGGAGAQLQAFGVVFARPFVRGNAVMLLDHMTDAIAAIDRAPDQPAWRQQIDASPSGMAIRGSPRRYALASLLLPSIQRSGEAHFRARNDRACGAIALAARAYAADHGGELPATLAAMVPEYLPRVPTDALIGGGAPIGYDPERRIIWHAGLNLRDDKGTDVDRAQTARWNAANTDTVYPLYRRPRVLDAPEATQPADAMDQ